MTFPVHVCARLICTSATQALLELAPKYFEIHDSSSHLAAAPNCKVCLCVRVFVCARARARARLSLSPCMISHTGRLHRACSVPMPVSLCVVQSAAELECFLIRLTRRKDLK
jgi:hypothetical protein